MTSHPGRLSRSTPRRLSVAALTGALALTLGACGSGDGEDDGLPVGDQPVFTSAPATTGDPTASAPQPGASSGNPVNPAEQALAAAATAVAAVDGSRLLTIDRDDAGGWDATVFTADGAETDVELSADGTSVTRGPTLDDDNGGDDADDVAERTRLYSAAVQPEDAVTAARTGVPDGTVSGLELDEQGGTAVWEVQVEQGSSAGQDAGDDDDETTVTVDATTGEVVGTETD